MPITVVVVEDDMQYNSALRKVIEYDSDLHCQGHYFDGVTAFTGIKTLNPDVAIVDIRLQDLSGASLISRLRKEGISTRFIMCTVHDDDSSILSSLKAGASGYLLKGESMDRIINAIKEVHNGEVPLTPSVARMLLKQFEENTTAPILTKSEHEIIDHISNGLSYRKIAELRSVSLDTVRKHIANIYRKLEVNNKIEAINKLKKRV